MGKFYYILTSIITQKEQCYAAIFLLFFPKIFSGKIDQQILTIDCDTDTILFIWQSDFNFLFINILSASTIREILGLQIYKHMLITKLATPG